MKKIKALYLDIENSRMIVEFPTYTLYDIKRIEPRYIKHDWYITCAAWSWLDLDSRKIGSVKVVGVNDDKKAYSKDFRDDLVVLKALHKIMSEADIIIGHNSDAFDLPKINHKFIKYGLPPIEKKITIDTLKLAKKNRASSNSLYYLCKVYNVPMKIELAPGIMHAADAGDEKALNKVKLYCKGDIISGASLYFKLAPYAHNHPNLNMFNTESRLSNKKVDIVCGNCNSKDVIKNGTRPTLAGLKQKIQCNSCGATTALPMSLFKEKK